MNYPPTYCASGDSPESLGARIDHSMSDGVTLTTRWETFKAVDPINPHFPLKVFKATALSITSGSPLPSASMQFGGGSWPMFC